jgi:anthranilate phosphoribosyltransferase
VSALADEPLRAALRKLAFGEALTRADARSAFAVLVGGGGTAAQAGALLMGLRARGETARELAGAADALRAEMRRVRTAHPERLVDTCGTGGGAVTTINLSTAAAFVAAGAGIPVAKHGNRSYTSRSGSADVLEALGVEIAVEPDAAAAVIDAAGIAFLFAPVFHPAMRHLAPARRELGTPTLMNLLGPLANPAGATRQVVGVADRDRAPLLAAALAELGSMHALVVWAEAGIDEVSPLGKTHVWEVRQGGVREWTLDPADWNLACDTLDGLAGGDPAHNAARLRAILEGKGSRVERAAVLLNAAAAVLVGGVAGDLADAVAAATESLDTGRALAALERLRARAAG